MTTLYAMAAINTALAPAAMFTAQSGIWALPVDNGVGDIQAVTGAAGGFDALASVAVIQPPGPLVPSGLRAVGLNHTSDISKQITCLQEAGAGGASTRTDLAIKLAVARLDSYAGLHVIGMGRILANGTFQAGLTTGAIATGTAIVNPGAGDHTITLQPGYGQVAAEAFILASPFLAQAASELRAIGVEDTTATTKRFTSLEEANAGGASTLTDMPMDFVILKLGTKSEDEVIVGKLHGAASVIGDNAAPTFAWQNGAFQNAITRNGAGDYTLTYQAGWNVAADEAVHFITRRGVMVASGLASFGQVRPAAATLRITSGLEAGGGAASVLSDAVNYDILSFRLL